MASCEKLKEAVTKASAKVTGEKIEASASSGLLPGGEVDPVLGAQVDVDAEGLILRKDLPYPIQLTVIQTFLTKRNGLRVARKSALGNEISSSNDTLESVFRWKRSGDALTLTIDRCGIVPIAPENGKEKPAAPVVQSESRSEEKVGLSGVFHLKGSEWKADSKKGDFKKIVWLGEIENEIDEVGIAAGILPRTHWFGKRRFKEKDSVSLGGEGLSMLFPGAEKGAMQLTYEGREAIGGHPCGRFSIKGDYSGHAIAADGSKSYGDFSITSGKIWLSLLYPVVLRGEYEMVIDVTSENGGVVSRMQGATTQTVSSEWKPGP